MGRPLKIRKYNGEQVVDQGYPNDGSTDNGYTGNQPGIVGGVTQDSDMIEAQVSILVKGDGTISSATNSTTVTGTGTNFTTDAFTSDSSIYVSDGNGGYTLVGGYSSTTDNGDLELDANAAVALSNSAWYYTYVGQGSIVRQKGARKFMVAGTSTMIQDESIAKGQAYMISDPSNTDWQALGAGIGAGQYDIFTATKSGHGLATNGVVWPVSTCVLVDEDNPTGINTMSVRFNDDGDVYAASRIKDHFVTNYEEPYANCNPGVEFVATFFDNSGTIDPASGKAIVAVENWC